MRIDHAKTRVLTCEIKQNPREKNVLEHIGKIAGVKTVPIVHPRELEWRGDTQLARAARSP